VKSFNALAVARHRLFSIVAVLAALALLIPTVVFGAKPPAITIQILNVSDWHGNVDPVGGVGGSWNISARWQQDRLALPSLTMTAGDDFGASPPLSSFFNEEPGVKAERMMGIQVSTFGNHNFDRGVTHLQSMIDLAGGASTGNTGAYPGQPYAYVAANLSNLDDNLSGVEPLQYFTVAGFKVAVIGIVNEEAPTLVSPGNFGTMAVTNGVTAANKYAKEAKHAGADLVIVATHKGLSGFVSGQPVGPLVDFAVALKGVDLVFGDHTNVQFSGFVTGADDQPILVQENASFGLTYSKTLVTFNSSSRKITDRTVSFVSPSPSGSLSSNNTSCGSLTFCDQAIVDMLVPYRQQLSALLDGQIATTTQPYDRGGNIERRQEVPLGNLIADGMRATYGTQFGYMNSGGIRAQFPSCSYQPANSALNRANWNAAHTAVVTCPGYASGTPYDIVKGDVYAVMPFGNNVLTRDVTGIQLWQMLENGVSKFNASGTNGDGRFPQVSGLKFTFHYLNPSGCSGIEGTNPTWACVPSRVTSVSFSDGTPIPYDGTTYSIATIDFLNNGGDSYTMLKDGQGATRDRDANVFLGYITAIGPTLDPTTDPLDRITKLP
jgi:5'-nucleotidase